ncbi:hypothetical protein ACTU3I_15820 [Microbacterium sp. RD1]|uniref:hypothetical protein n=1 Tax=Microbacterium sp. RD1 TaxID=3457313 RepID=UPI003FA5E313
MRRRTKIAAVIGGVVVAAAATVAVWALTRPIGPEEAARAYLAALESGDAAAVRDLIDGGDGEHADAVTAFEDAAENLDGARLDDISVSGDTASARAHAELAGSRREVFFGLDRADGRWLVSHDFLAVVEVTPTVGEAIRVGETVLPADEVFLLPAVYEIAGAPKGLVDGVVTVALSNDEPASATLDSTLSAEALARAQAELDSYARACTAPAVTVPEACGLRIPWPADLATASGFRYRVERMPTVCVSADARTFVADGGVVIATVTGLTRAGAPASFTYRSDDWTLRGSVALTRDSLTLAVN